MGSFVGAFWSFLRVRKKFGSPKVFNHGVVARAANPYAGPGDITVRIHAI
jgi:hypothetical protein